MQFPQSNVGDLCEWPCGTSVSPKPSGASTCSVDVRDLSLSTDTEQERKDHKFGIDD